MKIVFPSLLSNITLPLNASINRLTKTKLNPYLLYLIVNTVLGAMSKQTMLFQLYVSQKIIATLIGIL